MYTHRNCIHGKSILMSELMHFEVEDSMSRRFILFDCQFQKNPYGSDCGFQKGESLDLILVYVKMCVKQNEPHMSEVICWLCWKLQCGFDITASLTNQIHTKETRILNSCKKYFNDVENTRKVSHITVPLNESTELFLLQIIWKWTEWVNDSYRVELRLLINCGNEWIFSDLFQFEAATTFTTFPME